MCASKAENSSILQDQYKTSLSAFDLYDRVINLKLTTTTKDTNGNAVVKDEYVIRSDYEMYFEGLVNSVTDNNFDNFKNLKECQIVKCRQKPSIKVQYKRVSMSTPVSIDIYINNFFMLDKTGKMIKSFNNMTNQLNKVELAMGYFGQFENSLKAAGQLLDVVKISDLFDFSESRLNKNGITLITICDVAYVQTDSLPPDMTVHIHGFVGNYYSPSLSNMSVTDGLPDDYETIVSKGTVVDTNKKSKDIKSFVGQMFFEGVTKNWVRSGALPKKTTIELVNSSDFMVKGTLSESDALKYGVLVYFSKGAEDWAKEYEETKILTDSESGEKTYPKLTVGKAETALQKANLIKNVLGMQDFSIIPLDTNGCLFLYKNSEANNPSEMINSTALEQAYKGTVVSTYWKDKLPAVYNITTDALCTISCPYFFIVNPFQKFYFKSRYALSGLVSYYANFNATEDEFYALWQEISFATVDNANECNIVCTGKQKE